MKKTILLRTNLLICFILLVGFISVSVVGYNSNTGALKKDIEHVSALTSESIYYQIDAFFAKPVNVSLTMANDSLLKQFLSEETKRMDDTDYVERLQEYLHAYKEQYEYDSVFLVSTQTNRYYHFNGLDRVLTPDNSENVWYYEFLEGDEEYSLNVDNDEAAEDVITVFINCKINDETGKTVGVVGVGLRVQNLQQLLESYDEQYQIKAELIDEHGIIQISSEDTGDEGVNLFNSSAYIDTDQSFLQNDQIRQTFWQQTGKTERFIAAQYVPALKWHLIIENTTNEIQSRFERQFLIGLIITILIILLVLYIINRIVLAYNDQLVKLTVSQEMEYQSLLREATEELYENIYEFDITHDRAGGESTRQYFESLGLCADTPYKEALKLIAAKYIKPEFVEGYLSTFTPEHVLRAYQSGLRELYYDFMMTQDGKNYRWMRVRARIFYWSSDKSVRMITYRQDITAEKIQLEYQTLLQKATEELYENVFEFDITHDCASGESTKKYFESLGMRADTSYQEALKVIAAKHIKPEFVEGYLTTFAPQNVMHAYENGIGELYYDFMITNDGEHYRWMRIRARIFYWDSDQSMRMITYRQDITAEKEHELQILRMAQSDLLTGLYNKTATEELIGELLWQSDFKRHHALIMLDIDHFKNVNDTYGHAAGDYVIKEFGQRIRQQFRVSDICGRIGGDEFIIFLRDIPDQAWLIKQMQQLTVCLHEDIFIGDEDGYCAVSASIGIAISPESGENFETLYRNADTALYQSKEQGRDRFTIYQS